MLLQERIGKCLRDIQNLRPGDNFTFTFEIGYDYKESSSSLLSIVSKKDKLSKKKGNERKESRRLKKCYRDKYVEGENKKLIRSKLCTNANLIVQGSVLTTKIVKILEILKKKKDELQGDLSNVTSSGYSLKKGTKQGGKDFVYYRDVLSTSDSRGSSIASRETSTVNTEKRNNNRGYDKVSSTETSGSFYTTCERTSSKGCDTDNVVSSSQSHAVLTDKQKNNIPINGKRGSSGSGSSSNKHGIKALSPKMNRRIAKLIENEEKKRKALAQESAKKKKQQCCKIDKSSLLKITPVTSATFKTDSSISTSSLDNTQRDKTVEHSSVNTTSTTASTGISITDKSSLNGNVINTVVMDGHQEANNRENSSTFSSSVKTAELPLFKKLDPLSASTAASVSSGTVTAISINDKDIHRNNMNTVIENKKPIIPEGTSSSNIPQSNLSSVQTAQLPIYVKQEK
uniref:C2H2-type domain-containing protein n=1 Tax=Parastrongyloides trichosuri TaxID=131310 RepID=A0A0N4ZVJ3_PARTI